jgi:MFS family permease
MTQEAYVRKGKIFYGWFALAGAMLIIFIVGGSFVHSYGVLLPVLCEQYGWSRGVVAGALSAGIVSFGLPSPLFGILVGRLGPRIPLIYGNLLAGICIALISTIHEPWHIFLLYIPMGIGGGFGGYIACTAVANNWFVRKRSLALGIFTASAGLGGITFPPLSTALIDAMGWRPAWLVLAGIVCILAVLLGGVILVRNKPEDMGLTPDGEPADPAMEVEKKELEQEEGRVYGMAEIRRVFARPTAWCIGGFAAANSFSMGMMQTHQVAYLRDINYTAITAAGTMSFLSIFSVMGSLGFGTLAMRINVRYLASAAFVAQLIGLTILLTSKQLGFIYVYAALQGISNGSLIAALPTFIGNYYPRDRYAQVMGLIFPFQVLSNAASATVAGLIFDATGSYVPAFITAACLSFSGMIFAFMARPVRSIT